MRQTTKFTCKSTPQVFPLSPSGSGRVLVLLVHVHHLYQHRQGSDSVRTGADDTLHAFGPNLTPVNKNKTCGQSGGRATRTPISPHLPAPTVVSSRAAVLKTCPPDLSSGRRFESRSAQPRTAPASAAHRVWTHARGRGGASPAEERLRPISGRPEAANQGRGGCSCAELI